MKKKIIITIVAVVAVLAASLGITFAAWDKGNDKATLDATVGGNIDIKAEVVGAGDANEKVLVPKGTDGVNSAQMIDVLTLGAIKVSNNPVNGTSSDKDSLRVLWDITSVSVIFENTTEAQVVDVDEFKGIFDVEIHYGNVDIATYGGVVPMDTNLNVLMKFIDAHDTIPASVASKYRNAQFSVTVEFRAEIINAN